MKKIVYYIILLMIIILPNNVLAEGDISVSPDSLTIEQGSTKTFKITAFNTIGDVTIKSENSEIATTDTNAWETGMVDSDQTKEAIITVTGISVGTTQIVLELDASTFDDEDLSGQTREITINVIEKTNSSNSEIEDDNEEQENENNQEDTTENIGGDEDSDLEEEENETTPDNEDIDNPDTGSKIFLVMILMAICASTAFMMYNKKSE